MVPADPASGSESDDIPAPQRPLSPPPPQYTAADEISLDDPPEPQPGAAPEPLTAPPRPTLRGSGPESTVRPTHAGVRVGRPTRMLWLWAAPNSSVLGLIMGAVLFATGLSVRQSVIAALIGVALTATLLGVGVLRGRNTGLVAELDWPGVFGRVGARLISFVGLIVRVVWGAVLLWAFSFIAGGLGASLTTALALLAIGTVLGGLAAVVGYRGIAISAAVTTIVSGVLIGAIAAVNGERLDLPVALGIGDGPPELLIGGVVIVFSITALSVLPASTSIGRYQGAGSARAHAMWAALGTALPVLLLVAIGAAFSGSDAQIAVQLLSAPTAELTALAPAWAAVPIAGVAAFGLLIALALAIYSGGFALQTSGLRVPRAWATAVVAVLTCLAAVPFVAFGADGTVLLRDVVTSLAVPTAAVSGVMTTRAIVRRFRRSERPSSRPAAIRWNAFGIVALAATIGYGLSSASTDWLAWQGYLFPPDVATAPLAAADPGVLVALLVGGLVAVTDRPRPRRRERASHRDGAAGQSQ